MYFVLMSVLFLIVDQIFSIQRYFSKFLKMRFNDLRDRNLCIVIIQQIVLSISIIRNISSLLFINIPFFHIIYLYYFQLFILIFFDHTCEYIQFNFIIILNFVYSMVDAVIIWLTMHERIF